MEREAHVGGAGLFLPPGYSVAPSALFFKVVPGTTPRAGLGENFAMEGTPFVTVSYHLHLSEHTSSSSFAYPGSLWKQHFQDGRASVSWGPQ